MDNVESGDFVVGLIMRLLLSIFLFVALPMFGAVPSYDAFVGTNGITVSKFPPQGKVIIDGSGIAGSAAGDTYNVQRNSNDTFVADSSFNFHPFSFFSEFIGPTLSVNNGSGATNFMDAYGVGALGPSGMFFSTSNGTTRWEMTTYGSFVPYFASNRYDIGSFLLPVRTNWVNTIFLKDKLTGGSVPATITGALGLPGNSGINATGYVRFRNDGDSQALDIGGSGGPSTPIWLQAHDSSDQSVNHAMALQPNGGNVGIGTTTPANKLDVEGAVAIGASYSGTSTAPADGLIVVGNVGIGTPAPDYSLHVSRAGSSSAITAIFRLENSTIATANGAGVSQDFVLTDSAGNRAIAAQIGVVWGNYLTANKIGDLVFYTRPDGGAISETVRITGSGNVGIGTTTPRDKLEVAGGIIISNTGSGLKIGPGNATLTNTLYASATLDFPSTVAGAVSDLTITVAGATDGDVIALGEPSGSIGPLTGVYNAWAGNGVVYVRFANNNLVTAQDPASGVFKVRVDKFQ